MLHIQNLCQATRWAMKAYKSLNIKHVMRPSDGRALSAKKVKSLNIGIFLKYKELLEQLFYERDRTTLIIVDKESNGVVLAKRVSYVC